MVVAPSLRVTEPVAGPKPPATVTLTELAVPKAEGSAVWVAVTVAVGSAARFQASFSPRGTVVAVAAIEYDRAARDVGDFAGVDPYRESSSSLDATSVSALTAEPV